LKVLERLRGRPAIQRQLRADGRKPERLHLCVERIVLVHVLRQGKSLRCIASHGERKGRFHPDTQAAGEKLQSLRGPLFGGGRVAVGGFAQSGILQPKGCAFFLIRVQSGISCPPAQFARRSQMTGEGLAIGIENQAQILFGLGYKPLCLFRHGGRVAIQEGESVAVLMRAEKVHLLRHGLLHYLLRLSDVACGNQIGD